MQSAFLDINGVKTHVLTYGRWVDESSELEEPKDIILIIPGNPGVTRFYKMFMQRIHEKVKCPVWIVGHAGHEIPKNITVDPIPALKGNEKLFGLEGQVQHKMDFIEKYVPENARLHLIGHSFGSYIILEALKDEAVKTRVISVNFLFPAMEHLAETPSGKFLHTYIKPIVWLILLVALIYSVLPSILKTFLTICYLKITGKSTIHLNTVIDFIHPSILEKVFFLVFEELEQIRERNNSILKDNVKKIKLLYGKSDGWTPSSFVCKIKQDFPDIKTEICRYNHAFVFNQSLQVADLVGDSILLK